MGGQLAHDYLDFDAEAVQLVGERRNGLFQDYIVAIEQGRLRGGRVDFAYHEHRFCSRHDLFRGGGHPPDSFVAGALAWSLRSRAIHALPLGVSAEGS